MERGALVAEIEWRKHQTSNPEGLVQAFESNGVRATQDFKDKSLIVAGAVEKVGLDILNNAYVIVGPASGFRSVQCTSVYPQDVSSLHKGQSVTIEGFVQRLMGNVLLDGCELLPNLAGEAKEVAQRVALAAPYQYSPGTHLPAPAIAASPYGRDGGQPGGPNGCCQTHATAPQPPAPTRAGWLITIHS